MARISHSKKNKKRIIVVVAILVLASTLMGVGIFKRIQDNKIKELGEARLARNLDEYVRNDPELMKREDAEKFQLSQKEIVPPVSSRFRIKKFTMVPVATMGGDVVYDLIAELPGNRFLRIKPENFNKVFSVSSPGEALDYVDFLMAVAGQNIYARVKKTVWSRADYDTIGCKAYPGGKDAPLPGDRPISQARSSREGFEVDWVYFSPAIKSGYYKKVIQVGRDGGYEIKDDSREPFWPCGGGIIF